VAQSRTNRANSVVLESAKFVANPALRVPLLRWDRGNSDDCVIGDSPVYLHIRRDGAPPRGEPAGSHIDVVAFITYGMGAVKLELECSVGRLEILALPSDYIEIELAIEDADATSWPLVTISACVLPCALARPTLPRRTERQTIAIATGLFVAPPCARFFNLYSTTAPSGTLTFLGGLLASSRNLGIIPLASVATFGGFMASGLALPADTAAIAIANTLAARTYELQWILGT
jgi:hypothetical protein